MGYNKLLWGFTFLFDIRIQGFDILPDIIGYILFYQGLSILEDKNDFFNKGKRFALPMIVISIFDIYQRNVPMSELQSSSSVVIGIIFGLIIAIINLLMVYNICYGIKLEAKKINNFDLESQANNIWNLYLISSILVSTSFILLGLLQLFFIIVFVVSIISYILMLRLMNTASNSLE